MKVLFLTRYGRLGASSRVRTLQYLPFLASQGIEVTFKPLFSDAYLKALYSGGSRWWEVTKGYLVRIQALLTASKYDVVYVEKELFPFLPAIAELFLKLARVPYVVDYDDALFHRYDCHSNALIRRLLARKIDRVMKLSSQVIAGNRYLADRAVNAGAQQVKIIPTVLDIERYCRAAKSCSETLIVGWIGSPSTSRYLKPLLPVFESIRCDMSVRFVAVGAKQSDFEGSPVEVWQWSESTEVESIQRFDIGIMPLPNTPWERGKCGYKLIQYMACGVPVIASPVGVNLELVEHGRNGYLANSAGEWGECIRVLLSMNQADRTEMGEVGRAIVEKSYTLQVTESNYLETICKAAK